MTAKMNQCLEDQKKYARCPGLKNDRSRESLAVPIPLAIATTGNVSKAVS
jgi:hypothetical protein